MAEKAATAKASDEEDSPQVAHFKFQEKQLSDKLARLSAMSDADFGADKGHNRRESIRRTTAALEEVRSELKKAAK